MDERMEKIINFLKPIADKYDLAVIPGKDSLVIKDYCVVKVLDEAYSLSKIDGSWAKKTSYQCETDENGKVSYYVDTLDECCGEIERLVKSKSQSQITAVISHNSEMRRHVSAEKFEMIFKDFMDQADKNAVTGRSNGSKKSKYLGVNFFDGANLCCQYGQGAATKTPHINWWVLSAYYLPKTGDIIMGIEDYRYPHLNKMKPLYHKFIANKEGKV